MKEAPIRVKGRPSSLGVNFLPWCTELHTYPGHLTLGTHTHSPSEHTHTQRLSSTPALRLVL